MEKLIGIAKNDLSEVQLLKLEKLAHSLGIKTVRVPPVYDAEVYHKVTALIGMVPYETLGEMDRLEWIQSDWAGVDKLVIIPQIASGKIRLTNVSGAFGVMIAEHLLGGLLALYKRFFDYRAAQEQSTWCDCFGAETLYGKRVTVVGFGNIGSMFAKYAAALGAKVSVVAAGSHEKEEHIEAVYISADLDLALTDAEVLAMCLPNTVDTRNIIGKKQLEMLADGAIVLNAGRGATLDQHALSDLLQKGKLGGAVLDVFEREPLESNSPLWNIKNVFITPHVSGHSADTANRERIYAIISENILHYARGEQLTHVVDPRRGY